MPARNVATTLKSLLLGNSSFPCLEHIVTTFCDKIVSKSVTKYFTESKKIRRLENSNIWFCIRFYSYCQKLISGRLSGRQAVSPVSFQIFFLFTNFVRFFPKIFFCLIVFIKLLFIYLKKYNINQKGLFLNKKARVSLSCIFQ